MASPKALDQELLRKRLRPSEYITAIEEALETLRDHWSTIQKNQIDALKVMIDGYTKMLAKSLPDLRAIEITPERDSPVQFIFQTGESINAGEMRKRLGDAPDSDYPQFTFNS